MENEWFSTMKIYVVCDAACGISGKRWSQKQPIIGKRFSHMNCLEDK
jgi:hypothetical protein